MIWAIISSRSCICWLYRASPSSTAKNIINLISVLTIWWCPCTESSLTLLEEGVSYDQFILLAKLFTLYFKPKLAFTPDISLLPTFAFQFPMTKKTYLFGVSSKMSCRSSKNHSTSASSGLVAGHRPRWLGHWMVYHPSTHQNAWQSTHWNELQEMSSGTDQAFMAWCSVISQALTFGCRSDQLLF